MRIRETTSNDFKIIVEIWEKSVRATHHFLQNSDIEELKPLIKNEYLPAVDLFVVENEQFDIMGFMGLSSETIEMLFIAPGYFRMGLGKKLVLFAINEMKKTKVDVNEQNPGAISFYESMGFKVVGRSPVDSQGKAFPILHMELEP